MGARDWCPDDSEIGPESLHSYRGPQSPPAQRSPPTEHHDQIHGHGHGHGHVGDDGDDCQSQASLNPSVERHDCTNSLVSVDMDREKDNHNHNNNNRNNNNNNIINSNNRTAPKADRGKSNKSKIRKASRIRNEAKTTSSLPYITQQGYANANANANPQQHQHQQQEYKHNHKHKHSQNQNHEHYNQPHGGGPAMPYPRGQYPPYTGAQPPGYFSHPLAHRHAHLHSNPHALHAISHASTFSATPPIPTSAYSHPIAHPPPQQWPAVANTNSLYLPSAAPPYAHPNPYSQPQHHHHHGPHAHPLPPQIYGHSHRYLTHSIPAAMSHPHYTAATAAAAVDSRLQHSSLATGPLPTVDTGSNAVIALGAIDVTGNTSLALGEGHPLLSPVQGDDEQSDTNDIDSDNDKSISSHHILHHSYAQIHSDTKRNHIHRCPSNQTPDARSSSLTQSTSILSTCTSMTSTTSSYSNTKSKPAKKRKYRSRRSSPSCDDDLSDDEQDQSLKVLDRRQRKNTQSRARAAKLKDRIKSIQTKPRSDCTEEEMATLALYEERRQRKNGRSRERAMERKEQMERIMSIPEDEWTEKDKGFVGETMMAKFRKNEGDRLRRKKIKGMNGADGSASESASASGSGNVTCSAKSSSQPIRNATNFAKMLPFSIKTTPNVPVLKSEYRPDDKSISALTITPNHRAPSIRPLLGSNNLFKKFDEMVPQSSTTKKEHTKDHLLDNHQLQHNHHHQNNILNHNHNAPPLTPVQANTGSYPLDMSPPGSNVSQLFFAASPENFSHIIQSSPQRRSKENDQAGDCNMVIRGETEINLEHATPNSTGSILGSMLTPCNNALNTPVITDGDNNANSNDSGGSINILKTGHDYNWAAPIMVPTSMSSLSCLGSAASKNSNLHRNQRSMPQLTSPIRTSPLNLPRRDKSLLLLSSPRLRRSYARSGSPILRVLRKPFNALGEKVETEGEINIDSGDKECKKYGDHGCKDENVKHLCNNHLNHHQSNDHCHQRHHHTPHPGLRMAANGQDHQTTESITVSFSADTS